MGRQRPSERPVERQKERKTVGSSTAGPSDRSTVDYKGYGKNNKRFKSDPLNRLQAVERLSRSTAVLAKKTARQVATLFSLAVATILCPVLPALRNAGAVITQDPIKPLDVQFHRWGCLTKGLSEDPKTLDEHAKVLKEHVKTITDPEMLRGKVLVCKVKPSYRDADLYVINLRVSEEYNHLAVAVTETLVKAGGNVSFQPAARSGEERQVEHDEEVLDSLKA
jgi:hypothetical protein